MKEQVSGKPGKIIIPLSFQIKSGCLVLFASCFIVSRIIFQKQFAIAIHKSNVVDCDEILLLYQQIINTLYDEREINNNNYYLSKRCSQIRNKNHTSEKTLRFDSNLKSCE